MHCYRIYDCPQDIFYVIILENDKMLLIICRAEKNSNSEALKFAKVKSFASSRTVKYDWKHLNELIAYITMGNYFTWSYW